MKMISSLQRSNSNSAAFVCDASSGVDNEHEQEVHLAAAAAEQNMQALPPCPTTKQVRFSESSMLFLYHEDHFYVKKHMSYTKADQKLATQSILREAIRLKRKLLASDRRSSDKSDSPPSIEGHLKMCGIPKEEIVGIEHLVLEDPARTIERRNNHAQMVLLEQENQRMAGTNDCGRLAQLSVRLTKRPASQARSRAAMAA